MKIFKFKIETMKIFGKIFCLQYCLVVNFLYLCISDMVSLVQLVEHQIVVLGVMGSSPIGYPKSKESD